MPTIERARRVRDGMGVGYVICWDKHWSCYRVLLRTDHRVNYELPRAE